MSKKSVVVFASIWILSLLGYVGGVYILAAIVARYPSIGPFIFVDTHGSLTFSFWSAAIQPGGFMAVLVFCLAVEAFCLGIENSSIKRLIAGDTASARVDLFYVALRLMGGINLLAFVFSFGTLFWIVNQVHHVLQIGVLQHVNYVLQFAAVYLINTFVAYWGHRIMHTKWMWEIHKVHHAAEEMNIVTPFRNHPIDHVLNSLLNAVPVALLGASPGVVISYYAVNMVYQSLVHSEINLKGRLWDKIWITPAAHRIHHSDRVEHWNTNFGIMTVWDRLFGTYYRPKNEKLTYGVEDGELFNRPEYVSEVFANVKRWLGLGEKLEPTISQPSTLPMTKPDAEPLPLRKSA